MDNFKIETAQIKELIQCITETLSVDIPLFYINPGKAIRFNFENLDDKTAEKIIVNVLRFLFSGTPLWVCEYGGDQDSCLVNQKFFVGANPKTVVIPFHSKHVEEEWFSYENDTIACAYISLQQLCIEAYVQYCFRSDFLSNTIFLVESSRGVAMHIYDRRGMDVASVDNLVLDVLKSKYEVYLMN